MRTRALRAGQDIGGMPDAGSGPPVCRGAGCAYGGRRCTGCGPGGCSGAVQGWTWPRTQRSRPTLPLGMLSGAAGSRPLRTASICCCWPGALGRPCACTCTASCPPCGHGDQAQGAGTSPLSTWERVRPPPTAMATGCGLVPCVATNGMQRVRVRPPSVCGSGSVPPHTSAPRVRVRPPCGHCRSATGAGTPRLGMWEWVSPPLNKVPRERVRPP